MRFIAFLVLAGVMAGAPHAARAEDDAVVALADALAAQQDPRVSAALAAIDGTGPRLLALRAYLRSRPRLAERWSWTDEQIQAFDASPENVALLDAARGFVATPAMTAMPPSKAAGEFERFLLAYVPTPTPTIAAPGLSLHGQMRAIDFQVQQGSTLVAGTKTATIGPVWDGSGWTAKLEAAVNAAGGAFTGPLASPREPWHYTWLPEVASGRQPSIASP